MQKETTGSCLCGQVKYACVEAPQFMGNCHCRDCQKASGSAYTPAMFFLESAVKVAGELKSYESKGDSEQSIWRQFCPTCGTWVFSKVAVMTGLIGVCAGTLDDTSRFKPQLDMYTDSAACWDKMDPALPKFPKAPRS